MYSRAEDTEALKSVESVTIFYTRAFPTYTNDSVTGDDMGSQSPVRQRQALHFTIKSVFKQILTQTTWTKRWQMSVRFIKQEIARPSDLLPGGGTPERFFNTFKWYLRKKSSSPGLEISASKENSNRLSDPANRKEKLAPYTSVFRNKVPGSKHWLGCNCGFGG